MKKKLLKINKDEELRNNHLTPKDRFIRLMNDTDQQQPTTRITHNPFRINSELILITMRIIL